MISKQIILLLPFITAVWTPVVIAIINIYDDDDDVRDFKRFDVAAGSGADERIHADIIVEFTRWQFVADWQSVEQHDVWLVISRQVQHVAGRQCCTLSRNVLSRVEVSPGQSSHFTTTPAAESTCGGFSRCFLQTCFCCNAITLFTRFNVRFCILWYFDTVTLLTSSSFESV